MTLANLNEPHHALSYAKKDRKDSNIQEIGCLDGETRSYHNTKLCKLSLQPDKQSSLLAALFQSKNTQFSFNALNFFSLFCLMSQVKTLMQKCRVVSVGTIPNVT